MLSLCSKLACLSSPHCKSVFAASGNFFILWKQWYADITSGFTMLLKLFETMANTQRAHFGKNCAVIALNWSLTMKNYTACSWCDSHPPTLGHFLLPTNFSLCVIYAHTLVETYCKSAPFTAHAQEGPWTLDPEIRSFWQEFKLLIR